MVPGKTPLEWLRHCGAQGDVMDGLAQFTDWRSLWLGCPRGDWLLAIAERWTRGSATKDDVAAATRSLELAASKAVDPAMDAANRAALAVGLGVADRAVLPSAPAAAVESVTVASIDCGFELAMRWAHDKCAASVRAAVPWSVFEPCAERLPGAG
jgi:hypothetical protein